MAYKIGEQTIIIDKLLKECIYYDFYQFVRLLESAHKSEKKLLYMKNSYVNMSFDSKKEFIYFSTDSRCNFPLSPVTDASYKLNVFKITVSFFGLTGVNGTLPFHYSEKLMRASHSGNHAMHDFFGIFNHKIISLLYETWKKNSCYVTFTSSDKIFNKSDVVGFALSNISGAYDKNIEKELFAYYANYFSAPNRSALRLQNMLSQYFSLPIRILPLYGKWCYLYDEKTVISTNKITSNFNELGFTAILGNKQWTISNNFRIYVGPITYRIFMELKSNPNLLNKLIVLTRLYVNPELDFDVQIEIIGNDIPRCKLSNIKSTILGWNAWLINKTLTKNVNSVVMRVNN